jgi:hypothetical protein
MNGGLAHDILAREHANLNSCESWSAPSTARVAADDDAKALRNFFLAHSQSAQVPISRIPFSYFSKFLH